MEQAQHQQYMRRAIELSRTNVAKGTGGPFGAVIVKGGMVIGEGTNQVTARNDPTAHAEVEAIRAACAHIGNFDLSGAVVYTSCEPCPMCLAAIYWARLERIYFANTKVDAAAINFDDDFIPPISCALVILSLYPTLWLVSLTTSQASSINFISVYL